MLPKRIAFVDIETTGCRLLRDSIIEIGILVVEENKVIKTFSTLLNPECYVPPEIVRLTGIHTKELENAPTFAAIQNDVWELLSDVYIGAHNVRFDYGFLKAAFARVDRQLKAKHFCTVKLSRALYPQYKRHNLDSVIERFHFTCKRRHRAFDDASILWEFYQMIQTSFPKEQLEKTFDLVVKRPSIPLSVPVTVIDSLSESPGVYIFYGKDDVPLYVGKSINIKERVLSHFSSDIRSGVEMKIAQQIERIETIETAGELGALCKESTLVKMMQPLYNKQLRFARKLVILRKKKDAKGYSTVDIETVESITVDELEQIIGVFRSPRQAKTFLISLAKTYSLCEKLLGLEKTKTACFGYRLGRCKGACSAEELFLKYNMRFTEAFTHTKIKPWPFKGRICITEEHPFSRQKAVHYFDQWCYLGTETHAGESISFGKPFQFDVDTYKILGRFLKNAKNHGKITLHSSQQPFSSPDQQFSNSFYV